MSPQDQFELVQGERAKFILSRDGRKDVPGYLRKNKVLFKRRLAILANRPEFQIVRNIVESLSGHVIVNEVECPLRPAGRTGVEIDYVRSKRRNVGHRHLFSVCPELIFAYGNGAETDGNKQSLHCRRLHDSMRKPARRLKPCDREVFPVLPHSRYIGSRAFGQLKKGNGRDKGLFRGSQPPGRHTWLYHLPSSRRLVIFIRQKVGQGKRASE